LVLLNRTHRRLIRGIGRRVGSDSGRGPPRGAIGGFVSRRSQKHELTPDEHLFFVCVCSRDLFGNALLLRRLSKRGRCFLRRPPNTSTTYIHAVGVFVFVVVVVWGAERKGREQVFPRTERGEEAARRKKAKAERVKKSKKKRTIKLRCFCLCPSLAPSLLIMSKEVLSSAFFSERCFFAFFWTARTKGVLIKRPETSLLLRVFEYTYSSWLSVNVLKRSLRRPRFRATEPSVPESTTTWTRKSRRRIASSKPRKFSLVISSLFFSSVV